MPPLRLGHAILPPSMPTTRTKTLSTLGRPTWRRNPKRSTIFSSSSCQSSFSSCNAASPLWRQELSGNSWKPFTIHYPSWCLLFSTQVLYALLPLHALVLLGPKTQLIFWSRIGWTCALEHWSTGLWDSASLSGSPKGGSWVPPISFLPTCLVSHPIVRRCDNTLKVLTWSIKSSLKWAQRPK